MNPNEPPPPIDLQPLAGSQLDKFVELKARQAANDAIRIMVQAIAHHTQQARALLAQAEKAGAVNLEEIRTAVACAEGSEHWIEFNAGTFQNLYFLAFAAGAVWMKEQMPAAER